MKRRFRLTAVVAAQMVAAAGCGYPTFQFNAGGTGAGGAGGASTSSTTTASHASSSATSSSGVGGTTASSSSSASTASSSTSGSVACTIGHLVISQIRSRGPGGAYDEFIELWNPTSADLTLDGGWTLDARDASYTAFSYSNRWTGSGGTIPAHGHFLIVGSGYTQSPASDDTLGESITDAESLVLNLNGAEVDAVCYYYNSSGLGALTSSIEGFTCSGTPVSNPHDDTTGTNTDASLQRRPGGAAGNCVDTGNNESDFAIAMPATPEDTMSTPTPG